MLQRSEIPAHNLTVDRTTNHNSWVLRVEIESSDLDRGLQSVVQGNNVGILEVKDQDI